MNGVNFCSPISIYDGMYPRAAKAFEVQNVNWLRPRGASDRNLSLFGVFKPQYLDLIAALPDKSILDGVFTRSCDVANAWLAMRKWSIRLQDSGTDSLYLANDLNLTGQWDNGITAQPGFSIRELPDKRFMRFGDGLEYFQYWNAPLVVIPFGKHYELLIGKLSAQSFSDFALVQFWKLVMQDMKPAKTKFTGTVAPMWAIPETPMEVSFLQGLKAQTGDIVGQALAAAKSTMVAAGFSFMAAAAVRLDRGLEEESRKPLNTDMKMDGPVTFAIRLRNVREFARVPLAVGQIGYRRFANRKNPEPKIQFGE